MLSKKASVISYASKALGGDGVKKAIKKKKFIKKHRLSGLEEAKKNVRRAKDAQNFVRGTAAAGLGGAYLATHKSGDGDSIIPKDY